MRGIQGESERVRWVPRAAVRKMPKAVRALYEDFGMVSGTMIGVPPGEAVGRGHAAADAVEQAIEQAVPGTDVVVHVETRDDDDQDIADRVLVLENGAFVHADRRENVDEEKIARYLSV